MFYRFIEILHTEMERPKPYGWFHLVCIFLTILSIFLLRNKKSEKSLKAVLGTYGIIALILEVLKNISWSANLDSGIITWDYQWYIFPFQLCSLPIYISLICFFTNNKKVHNYLLPFLAYVTILGGIATILLPDSCFTNEILININTMWIHCASLVLSFYLMLSGHVKPNLTSIKNAISVFIWCILIASLLNYFVYKSNILNGETFNMFFISPYFNSTLPLFSDIQPKLPYMIFLLIYFLIVTLGSLIIYGINYLVVNRPKKMNKKSIMSILVVLLIFAILFGLNIKINSSSNLNYSSSSSQIMSHSSYILSKGSGDFDPAMIPLMIAFFALIGIIKIAPSIIRDIRRERNRKLKKQLITSLTEEEIHRIDYSLDIDGFKEFVYDSYVTIEKARMNFDYDTLRNYLTDELYNTYLKELEELKEKCQKNIISNLQLIQAGITKIDIIYGVETITAFLAVSYNDYIVNEDNLLVRGSKDIVYDMQYILTFVKSPKRDTSKKFDFVLSKKELIRKDQT